MVTVGLGWLVIICSLILKNEEVALAASIRCLSPYLYLLCTIAEKE